MSSEEERLNIDRAIRHLEHLIGETTDQTEVAEYIRQIVKWREKFAELEPSATNTERERLNIIEAINHLERLAWATTEPTEIFEYTRQIVKWRERLVELKDSPE